MNTFLRAAIAGWCILFSINSQATEPAERKVKLDIKSQPVADALNEFAKQSGLQIVFYDSVVSTEGASPSLIGTFSPEQALQRLLQNTSLRYEFVNDRTVGVGASLGADRTKRSSNSNEAANTTSARTAVAVASDRSAPAKPNDLSRAADANSGQAERAELEEILVTGTHIRGLVSPVGAQLVTLDRAQIERTGFTTVQDVIRSLPQNFQGGPSEDTQLVGGQEALFNASVATGLNLRGLGSGSTLVLVNGRRLAPGSGDGRFADISGIPLAAVERVEVLPDGASAVYGADAVGGVVNFILRDHYEGAESQVTAGSVTDGDSSELQLSQAVGSDWESGNALLLVQYFQRDSLAASERRQSAISDLRSLGGDNFDVRESNPGNIVVGTQTWAIPAGQDGRSLTPADFVSGTVNFQNRNEGRDLSPEHEQWSVVSTVHQDLGERVRLFADVFFGRRRSVNYAQSIAQPLLVPTTNAFYVNPTGGTGPIAVQYNFVDDFGNERDEINATTANGAIGSIVQLGSDWSLTGYGGYALSEEKITAGPFVNGAALTAALADPDPATAFNPFGDGSFTNPQTLASIRESGLLDRKVDFWLGNVTAGGTLATVLDRDLKLAVGADYRKQSLDSFSRRGAAVVSDRARDRTISATYAELLVPIIPASENQPGIERVDLSLAGRHEDYSDFGTTTTPKVGLTWAITTGLSLRGTWSKSFKAPNLVDLDESTNGIFRVTVPDSLSSTGTSPILAWNGGNADLTEETATSWSAGIDITPSAVPGLNVGVTYFDIDFDDRIETVSFSSAVLQNPALANLVTRNPTTAQREMVCSRGTYRSGNAADCINAPVAALVDVRINNVAITKTSGLDLVGRYELDNRFGTFTTTLYATYLLEFEQTRFLTNPLLDLLDTQNNPLNLRVRGSLAWNYRGFGASAFVNYTDDYVDIGSEPERRIGTWTTVDLQLSYETDRGSGSWIDGTRVALSIQNLFDRDPPFLNNPQGVGYDQQNADVRGRFVSLQLRKNW